MAHEITAQDSLYLATEKAWHGIGNVLPEAVSPLEAMAAADLDWEVKVLPQFFVVPEHPQEAPLDNPDGPKEDVVWQSQYSQTVVRLPRPGKLDMDGNPEQFIELSSVGMSWTAIQNRRIFEMAESALGKGVKLESAGSMQQGRKVFALLRGDSFAVGGNDEMVKYLLLVNGHDAEFSFRAIPTSVRVVCMNTLKLALQGTGMLSLRHVGNAEKRLAQMETALQTFKATGSLFEEKVAFLAAKELKVKQVEKFWKEAWTIVHDSDELPTADKAVAEMKEEIESWSNRLESEKLQLGSSATTMWLAANAVTGILQHGAPKRKTKDWEENRADSNLFGTNDVKTTKIMQAALALA